MPYGAGKRLGDTVRPELGSYDYSGVERAGAAIGQGMVDIGQGLRVRSNEKKQIEKSLKLAKDIGELIPELQPQAQEAIQMMIDPNRSHRDQLAIAEGIKDTLNLGLMMKDDQYKQRALDLEAMRAMASMRGDGDPYSILSPQEMDAYTQAGYQMPEVYRLPDGNFQVKMARKPPSPGGMSIVAGPDGGMQFVPTGGSSFGKTPGYEAMGLPSSVPPNEGGVLPPRNDSNAPPPDIAPWPVDQYGYPLQQQAQPAPPAGSTPLEQAVGGFGAGGMFGGKVPGEILKVDAQGRPIGATQVPGSLSAQAYAKNEADIRKSNMEADAKAREAQDAQAGQVKNRRSSDIRHGTMIDNLYKILDLNESAFKDAGIKGGVMRAATSKIPGSVASKIAQKAMPVDAALMLKSLMDMKEASKTGAAGLGALNQTEAEKLSAQWANLSAIQDPETLKFETTRLIGNMLDLVHGSRAEREQAYRDGKIAFQDMVEVENQYPSLQPDGKGNLIPRPKWQDGTGNIAPDVKELIKKYPKQP